MAAAMNRAAVASLLRQIAAELEAPDEREEPPRKRGPRVPLHPPPRGEVSELDAARARAILKAKGIR